MALTKTCVACGKLFEKPPTNSKAQWETRTCCSRACGVEAASDKKRGRPNPRLGDAHRGKKQSPEHRARRVESIRRTYAEGNVGHARANLGLRGEQTTQWKGDNVQYRAAHWRLRAHRGEPSECEHCGGVAHEWALSDDAEVVMVQVTGPRVGLRYSPQPSDYIALCRPCHRLYDRERDPVTGRYL